MKRTTTLLPIILLVAFFAAAHLVSAQALVRDSEIVKKLTPSQKKELNAVFPLKTRKHLLGSKSLFITKTSTKQTLELTDPEANRKLLDTLFLDAAQATNVVDTCRKPEYWIQSESGPRAEVMFGVSYGCNDITGTGMDFHLIQGRIDGKNNRSIVILRSLFLPVSAGTR